MKLKQALKNQKENSAYNTTTTPPRVQQSPPSPAKLLPFELMYPPGKLLHITETPAFRSSRRVKDGECASRWNIRWADRNEFREIVISPRMVMDHVPFRPNKALQDLTRRWLHSQNSEETSAQDSGINSNNFNDKCVVVKPPSSLSTVPLPIQDFVPPQINQSKQQIT